MIKTISLTFGYAEGQSIGQLIFSNREVGPMEVDEALKTLAEDMYAFYLYECVAQIKNCCKQQDADRQNFCSMCGSHLSSGPNDSYDAFRDFLWELMSYDADRYGPGWECIELPDDEWHEVRWQYCGVGEVLANDKSECLVFHSHGCKLLAEILRKYYPNRLKDYQENDWYDLDKEIEEAGG